MTNKISWEDLYDLWEDSSLRQPIDRVDFSHQAVLEGCGDKCYFDVKISNGVIIDIRHNSTGCVLSQAVAAYIVDSCKGKTIEEAMSLEFHPDFHVTRTKCAAFPILTFKEMLNGQTDTA